MAQYAKYISETEVQYPTASEFLGVINWRTHDAKLREKGYAPLRDVPEQREGYTLTLDRFAHTAQTKTVIEPRPVIVPDYDPETGEKTGEHTEWQDTEITLDDSYITVTDYHYNEVPQPQPEDTTARDNAEKEIVSRIRALAQKYGAVDDIEAMTDLTIPALRQLAIDKGVSDEDWNLAVTDIQVWALQLQAVTGDSWAVCWEGLKNRFAQWWNQINNA